MSSLSLESRTRSFFERPISRSRVLRLAAVGGIASIAGADFLIANLHTAKKNVSEVDSELGKLVENIYNIKLTQEPGAAWNTPGILIVGETLAHLPPHTYAPHDGQPLEFVSTLHPSDKDYKSCYAFSSDRPDLGSIRMMPSILTTEDKIYTPDYFITHELTHRVDLSGGGFVQQAFLSIIDQDFNQFAASVNRRIDAETRIDSQKNPSDEIIQRIQYGLTLPAEFVAVLSEQYTWGEEVFSRLSRWINADKVAIFYEVLKTEIFRGKTYKDHGEITDGLVFDEAGNAVKIGFLGIDKTKEGDEVTPIPLFL